MLNALTLGSGSVDGQCWYAYPVGLVIRHAWHQTDKGERDLDRFRCCSTILADLDIENESWLI